VIERISNNRRLVVIAVGVIAVVAIVATSVMVLALSGGTAQASASPSASPTPIATPSPSPTDSPTPLPTPSPTPAGPTPLPADWAYSDLDGVAAPKDLAHRLPLVIMIDDNTVARPQSGMSSASIVYQAPADGGEDRYMVVFQEGTARDIGPVRSARPYFVYWAAEYKPLYGHFGGDDKSLTESIPSLASSLYNMDGTASGGCPFRRITTRAAPHNAYTTSADLIGCLSKFRYPATFQNVPVRSFTDPSPVAQLPASQSITVPYRTGTIGYKFDPTSDSYIRSIDGDLQVDPANNQQVKATTVVVMYQALSTLSDGRPWVASVGTGKGVVFMEGKAIDATWKKTTIGALTRWYDSSGKEITLVRGEIFIQSVPIGTAVTYK
jgi:hypothetical protein